MRLMVLLLAVSARMGHALLSSTKSRFISRYNNNMAASSLRNMVVGLSSSSCTAADDDLTLEEYILRLSEVRGHYRSTGELSKELVCMNMFATQCVELNLNRCYLGMSTVPGAGRKLCASRDIRGMPFYTGKMVEIHRVYYLGILFFNTFTTLAPSSSRFLQIILMHVVLLPMSVFFQTEHYYYHHYIILPCWSFDLVVGEFELFFAFDLGHGFV